MLYHVNLFIGHYTVHMAFRESVTDFFFHLGPNLLQLNKATINLKSMKNNVCVILVAHFFLIISLFFRIRVYITLIAKHV